MTKDTNQEKIWDPDMMIDRARALRRLAEELERDGDEAVQADSLLFVGKCIAVPVILSLATEIALKAWQCRERRNSPDKGHDLLKLFDNLEENSQNRLKQKMPEVLNGLPRKIDFPPAYPGIRRALCQNKNIFVEWRYAHEHLHLNAETSVLMTALTAIIEAYDESSITLSLTRFR